MIYPTLPPPPRDPLLAIFMGAYKAALILFLVAVAGLVVGVVVDARNSLDNPTMSAVANRR